MRRGVGKRAPHPVIGIARHPQRKLLSKLGPVRDGGTHLPRRVVRKPVNQFIRERWSDGHACTGAVRGTPGPGKLRRILAWLQFAGMVLARHAERQPVARGVSLLHLAVDGTGDRLRIGREELLKDMHRDRRVRIDVPMPGGPSRSEDETGHQRVGGIDESVASHGGNDP